MSVLGTSPNEFSVLSVVGVTGSALSRDVEGSTCPGETLGLVLCRAVELQRGGPDLIPACDASSCLLGGGPGEGVKEEPAPGAWEGDTDHQAVPEEAEMTVTQKAGSSGWIATRVGNANLNKTPFFAYQCQRKWPFYASGYTPQSKEKKQVGYMKSTGDR